MLIDWATGFTLTSPIHKVNSHSPWTTEGKRDMMDWAMELCVHTAEGDIPLSRQTAAIPLPQGPDGDAPLLHYGPYLEALSRFFGQDRGAPLLQAVSTLSGRDVAPLEIRGARLISEKHGALYQVARLTVELPEGPLSWAVNVASTDVQKAVLQSDHALLQHLHERFGLPYLPRPILMGQARYESPGAKTTTLDLLVTEWLEGYREFHLTRLPQIPCGLGIAVWEADGTQPILTPREEHALYREASALLTAYFDTESYAQIYPWHHAAGDFVVARCGEALSVRLITARGYRPLGDFPESDGALFLAALHFILNLSLRMRLDRLDGTGELAWAGPHCIQGILEGFVQAWTAKRRDNKTLPSADHLLDLLRQFSREDWMAFGQLVLEDGMVEREEGEYLAERLGDHLHELSEAVGRMSAPGD